MDKIWKFLCFNVSIEKLEAKIHFILERKGIVTKTRETKYVEETE